MKNTQGFSYIEVLVSLVILATGILGAVAMQTTAQKGSFDAMQRSQASALAQDIIERMRSNDVTILSGYAGVFGDSGESAPLSSCEAPDELCTPIELRANDLYQWEQKLLGADVKKGNSNVGGLVGALGCITFNDNAVTVAVSWESKTKTKTLVNTDNGFASDCKITGDARHRLIVEAFIF